MVHNGSIHRGFGALRQRALQFDEVVLAQLEARLLQLDKEDEAKNDPMLYSLSPAQTIDGLRGIKQGCEKDEIIALIQSRLVGYSKSPLQHIHFCPTRIWLTLCIAAQGLLQDAEVRKLHRIYSHDEIRLHLDTAEVYHILDGEAKGFLNAPHDLITTRPERLHASLERLVFGNRFDWLLVGPNSDSHVSLSGC